MSKKSVLIIEDIREMLETIKVAFERNKDYEFEVTGVTSAKEANELLKKIEQTKDMQAFDVMVIDIRLEEERSGVMFINQLTQFADKCRKSIQIVFTGWSSYEDCVECMRYGAYDYIVKGKGEGSILKVVESAVSRLKELEKEEQRGKYITEEWMFTHRKEFEEKYAGQYIAVGDTGEIISSAPDIISLREDIWAKRLGEKPSIIRISDSYKTPKKGE